MRFVVLRTYICGVISYPYTNKLDVAERSKRVQGAKTPVAGLGDGGSARGPGAEPLSGISSLLVAVQKSAILLRLRRQGKSAFSAYF